MKKTKFWFRNQQGSVFDNKGHVFEDPRIFYTC